MIGTYVIGVIGIIGLMIVWVIVMRLWGKSFPEHKIDEDVLAGRSDCGSCGCTTPCNKKLLEEKKI